MREPARNMCGQTPYLIIKFGSGSKPPRSHSSDLLALPAVVLYAARPSEKASVTASIVLGSPRRLAVTCAQTRSMAVKELHTIIPFAALYGSRCGTTWYMLCSGWLVHVAWQWCSPPAAPEVAGPQTYFQHAC